jgi:anti-sigma factor RsiW
MSKECSQFKGMIQAALDGMLADGQRADFDRHLALCRDCRVEFEAFQLSLDLLAVQPVPEPGPGFTTETIKKAIATKKRQVRRQWFFSWVMGLITLLISALMVTGWVETIKPAIGRMLTSLLQGLMEFWALLNGLINAVSALLATLAAVINALLPLSRQNGEMLFFEFGIALALILITAFILKSRHSTHGRIMFSL